MQDLDNGDSNSDDRKDLVIPEVSVMKDSQQMSGSVKSLSENSQRSGRSGKTSKSARSRKSASGRSQSRAGSQAGSDNKSAHARSQRSRLRQSTTMVDKSDVGKSARARKESAQFMPKPPAGSARKKNKGGKVGLKRNSTINVANKDHLGGKLLGSTTQDKFKK